MLEIKNFNKQFKNKCIVNNANLIFEENKIHYITGSNGAGKTTFLKCLLNIENYKGEILYNNQKFEKVRNMVEVIYDDSPLYPHLSGYKNVKMLCKNEITRPELDKYVNKFNLKEILHKKVKNYSYGQRKKLSLIIGLISKPKYLLLDEITNGLDYDSMIFLKEILSELSMSTTIIVTGHHFEFYNVILDEIYVMDNGSFIKSSLKIKDEI